MNIIWNNAVSLPDADVHYKNLSYEEKLRLIETLKAGVKALDMSRKLLCVAMHFFYAMQMKYHGSGNGWLTGTPEWQDVYSFTRCLDENQPFASYRLSPSFTLPPVDLPDEIVEAMATIAEFAVGTRSWETLDKLRFTIDTLFAELAKTHSPPSTEPPITECGDLPDKAGDTSGDRSGDTSPHAVPADRGATITGIASTEWMEDKDGPRSSLYNLDGRDR